MFHLKKSSVLSLFLALILLVCLLPMASLAGAAPLSQGKSYTVQKDDSLWNIAEKYLGKGWAYRAIVYATSKKAAEDATFATIYNSSLIQPGWKLWVPSTEEAEALMGRIQRPEPTATPVILDQSGMPIPNRWPCAVQATQFNASDFGGGEDLQALQMALQPVSDAYRLALFARRKLEFWAEIDNWFGPNKGPESWGTQVQIGEGFYPWAYKGYEFPPAEYGVIPQPTRPPVGPGDDDDNDWILEVLAPNFIKECPASEPTISWIAYPLRTLSDAQGASDPLEFDELLRESLLASFGACSILPLDDPGRQMIQLEVIPDLLGLAALREVWIEPEMMAGWAPSP